MDLQQLYDQFKQAKAALDDVAERYEVKASEFEEKKDRLMAEWEQSNAELIKERAEAIRATEMAETALRDAIREAYAANPASKTVAPGLSVRITTNLVYDKKQAFEWAKEHGLALALDTKAFEKIASVQPLDFVTTKETVNTVIGK